MGARSEQTGRCRGISDVGSASEGKMGVLRERAEAGHGPDLEEVIKEEHI